MVFHVHGLDENGPKSILYYRITCAFSLLYQVLGSVRTKVDSYAQKIDNFSMLLLQARNIMIEKSETLESENEAVEVKQRSASMMTHAGDRETDQTRSPGK